MPYFPQLLTGAASQFPTAKRLEKRTIRSVQPDGRRWKVADPSWSTLEWRLELAGLTSEEWNAIENLFHAVEGRLGSFTFLDPTDNLLAWSEDLSAAAWTKDPFLELTAGVSDPVNTSRATRLSVTAAIPQKIEQALEIPGWFQYCFSLYARSDAPAELSVSGRTATAAGTKAFSVGPAWKRLEHSLKLANSDAMIHFGLEVQPGATVDVFGLQVEAQAGASKYKKTLARSGVHEEAHFLDDILEAKAEGPEQCSCVVKVGARV